MKLLPFLPLVLVSFTSAQLVCPSGYTLVNQQCLMLIGDQKTHGAAEADCTYTGGTLVNIRNSIENYAVAKFAGSANIWIGLFCFNNFNSTATCYYDDFGGTTNNYDNFAKGEPRLDTEYGGCVYLDATTGKWSTTRCDAVNLSFVCEVPVSNYDPSCTHFFGNYCYRPSHEIPNAAQATTFDDAQSICKADGGNLVSIHSKRENDFIKSIYRAAQITDQIYIGANTYLSNTYEWLDNSNWDRFVYVDLLSSTATSWNCLTMDPSGGFWSPATCTSNRKFLCKRLIGKVGDKKVEKEEKEEKAKDQFDMTTLFTDFSNCNSTFLMTPTTITSVGYPMTVDSPPNTANCTWHINTVGAYRIAAFFTDVSTYNSIYIYDERGVLLNRVSYTQKLYSPSNMITVQFQSSGMKGYRGFKASFLAF